MSDIWGWQDFSYLSGKSRIDSRRAAFLLYDFINKFGIEDFKILRSNGESTRQTIEVAYKIPDGYTTDQIDDLWDAELESWADAH